MSKIKNAFFNTILYQNEIEEDTDGDTVSLELAYDMLNVIDRLEYELALYHAGCSKTEIDKLMKSTYKPMRERYKVAK